MTGAAGSVGDDAAVPRDALAPVDPRDAWPLPPLGTLPVVADVDPLVARVIAGNASPLTLDGTNTYVVGAPGAGTVLIVDPGPDGPDDVAAAHRDRVATLVDARGAEVVAVVTTHRHPDHAGALAAFGAAFGAPTIAAGDLADGACVGTGDASVTVVATPGHAADHVALVTASGAVLTGDHVLGRGTSVIAAPDGDLAAHLASLDRVRALGAGLLLPGHGPAVDRDVDAVLAHLAAHRAWRTERVAAVLAARAADAGPGGPRGRGGPGDGAPAGASGGPGAWTAPRDLLGAVYGPLPDVVRSAALASLEATLVWLVHAGRAQRAPDGRFRGGAVPLDG